MKRRTFIGSLAIGAVPLTFAIPASAHKLQYSLTELRWRGARGALEVIHSVHLDDAMSLLARLGAPSGELDLKTEARLMLYVEQNFLLSSGDEAVSLDPVGARLDGDYLWIYQEQLGLSSVDIAALKTLTVQCSIMHDLFPAQQNQVNLRIGDKVRTLKFNRDLVSGSFSSL